MYKVVIECSRGKVMRDVTAKGIVSDYLKANGGWVASHEIERLSEIHPYMASNLSRRARQLVEEGAAEKKRVGKIEYFRYATPSWMPKEFTSADEANNFIKSLGV